MCKLLLKKAALLTYCHRQCVCAVVTTALAGSSVGKVSNRLRLRLVWVFT